jgi:glycosyltransferase involved in cell wall biosynthesis
MRILIATDAWYPQVNGVVRTLSALAKAIQGFGATIEFVTPEGMPSFGLPSYPGIRLALPNPNQIARQIKAIRPDAIHIATEGPIGHVVRWHCRARRRPFTTSFHTRFADYAVARWPVPEEAIWSWLRWFHNAGRGTMAATPSLAEELTTRGFRSVMRWPRGVDANLFRPRPKIDLGVKAPIFLTVGRLAVEKNLEAFLSLDLPGTKVVVGEGPAQAELMHRFSDAVFLGHKEGEELASIYASADVFVFPSRTDTFGLPTGIAFVAPGVS